MVADDAAAAATAAAGTKEDKGVKTKTQQTRPLEVQFRVKEKDTGAVYSATQVVDVITQVLRVAFQTQFASSPSMLKWYQTLRFEGPLTQQSIEAGFSPVSIEKSQEIALDPPRPIAFDEREWSRFKTEARERSRRYDKASDEVYNSVKIRRPPMQDPTLLIPKALYGLVSKFCSLSMKY